VTFVDDQKQITHHWNKQHFVTQHSTKVSDINKAKMAEPVIGSAT